MRHFTLILTVVLLSCDGPQERLQGTWIRYHSDDRTLPLEMRFENDSCTFIDELNFKQSGLFQAREDSVLVSLNSGVEQSFSILFSANSEIEFGGEIYEASKGEVLDRITDYQLINYKSGTLLHIDGISSTIHLVRINDSLKVILDDTASDLEGIRQYLDRGTKDNLPVQILVEESIDFKDLVNCYKFIFDRRRLSVKLITASDGLGQFHSLNDNAILGDSLMVELFDKVGLKPGPPFFNTTDPGEISINLNRKKDIINLPIFDDSRNYLIIVNYDMEINDYFDLLRIVDKKQNVKKIINSLD